MFVLSDSSKLYINYFTELQRRAFGLRSALFEDHVTEEGLNTRTILKFTPGKTHNSCKSLLKHVWWSDKMFKNPAQWTRCGIVSVHAS